MDLRKCPNPNRPSVGQSTFFGQFWDSPLVIVYFMFFQPYWFIDQNSVIDIAMSVSLYTTVTFRKRLPHKEKFINIRNNVRYSDIF